MTELSDALFLCDALVLMEHLPSAELTVVYLDPPWGTESRLGEPEMSILTRNLAKVVQQAHRLLNDSGSLIVHLSQLSPIDLRLIVSQIFGRQPSYEITWHLKSRSFGNSGKSPRVDNELLLVYAKSNDPIFNPEFRPRSAEESAPFLMEDERGPFRAIDITTAGLRTPQGVWRGFALPAGRSWRYSLEKLEALALDNRIHFPSRGGLPRLKQYLSESAGVEVGVTWDDIPAIVPTGQRIRSVSQRPVALLERIIRIHSNPGDRVLDPFCGSGTTSIAAHMLNRRWWCGDNNPEYCRFVVNRLASERGLHDGSDYSFISQGAVESRPLIDASYKSVVTEVGEIARLQETVSSLTDHLLQLKRLMRIGEDEPDRIEEAIAAMTHWIAISIANESKSVDNYVPTVQGWLNHWERLDQASQSFLPQAELLYESIEKSGGADYSPFILQYCRALENELLQKLFSAYTSDVHDRHGEQLELFLSADLNDEKAGRFAKMLAKRRLTYTLGDMNFVMGLTRSGGRTLESSRLLQDFKGFALRYFTERIVDKAYLDQIDRITNEFRNKAAHPNLLDARVALRCRDQVRTCLNELIMNYRGPVDDNIL